MTGQRRGKRPILPLLPLLLLLPGALRQQTEITGSNATVNPGQPIN